MTPMHPDKELKPCPFCGCAPDPVPQNDDCPVPAGAQADGQYYLTIWCEECGAEGGKRLTRADAIAAWNTRPDRLEGLSGGEAVAWRMVQPDGSTLKVQDQPFHTGFAEMMARDCGSEVQPLYAAPRPMPGREEVASDLAWLESLKDNGHCGEGTMERRDRYRRNDRIDRLLSLFSASLGGREDTASRVTDSGRGALPTPPEGSERPISPLRVLADDGPEWQAINALFVRHGLEPPPVRLRDELVNHLAWAKFGAAQGAHAGEN